jgi:hypothetical protein
MAFVVNRKGAVHSVPDEWLSDLLAHGYRQATAEEIAQWYRDQGLEVPADAAVDGASGGKAKKAPA